MSEPLTQFLVQVVVILVLVRLLAKLLHRIRQPMVIGEIIAGVLLGPSAFGQIPGFSDAIFPKSSLPILGRWGMRRCVCAELATRGSSIQRARLTPAHRPFSVLFYRMTPCRSHRQRCPHLLHVLPRFVALTTSRVRKQHRPLTAAASSSHVRFEYCAAGLEVEVGLMTKAWKSAAPTAVVSIVIPFLCGAAIAPWYAARIQPAVLCCLCSACALLSLRRS